MGTGREPATGPGLIACARLQGSRLTCLKSRQFCKVQDGLGNTLGPQVHVEWGRGAGGVAEEGVSWASGSWRTLFRPTDPWSDKPRPKGHRPGAGPSPVGEGLWVFGGTGGGRGGREEV